MKTTAELLEQARATHGEGSRVTEAWRGPDGQGIVYASFNQRGYAKISHEAFALLAERAGFERVHVEIETP